jgi:hypothetical protein
MSVEEVIILIGYKMKKCVFCAVVLLCVGCTTIGTKQEKRKTAEKQAVKTDVKDVAEDDDEFRIETMSDKDFYFKADTVLPNNSVIRDMVDAANSYAILRAAYCDAELWFRFGGVVNDEIRYLHEVWRTWRCLKQIEQSPSRDGMILNLEYNQMRYRCLNTILRKIIKNTKDIKAINDFLFLATYDNIVRFNEFPYGNSANLERMMLFPEVMDDE